MIKLTLNLNGSTQNLEFDQDIITIGRSGDNMIPIKNHKVSRKHAKIERIGAGLQITDLESGNGTRVNGKKIDFSPVGKDDVIKIGDAVLTLEDIDEGPEGISLDDDDEEDLLPPDEDISKVKTEVGLQPLDPGLHGKDTEVEIDVVTDDDIKIVEEEPEPPPKAGKKK